MTTDYSFPEKAYPAYSCYQDYLNHQKNKNLYRQLRQPLTADKLSQAIFFNQNDYLHLSHHPEVIAASQAYARNWGVGSGSSGILSYLPIYQQLENRIARTKHKEHALIFNSGYQTNASVIATLLDKRLFTEPPLIFCDRLNHASIHHGCQLAGVRQIRYRHLDLDHLDELLQSHQNQKQAKFIITESIFSMDGDQVNIAELVALAQKHRAFLYVDEAHATGASGKQGYGLTSGYETDIDLIMGTFSKAIGATGGYICCNQLIYHYLINRCRGFIYSTAPSPAIIGAVDQAWQLILKLEDSRKHLMQLANYTRRTLQEHGFNTGQSSSHIIPIIIGNEKETLNLYHMLKTEGIYTSAIRPPTVPAHSSRLRIGLQANHSRNMVDRLINLLRKFTHGT